MSAANGPGDLTNWLEVTTFSISKQNFRRFISPPPIIFFNNYPEMPQEGQSILELHERYHSAGGLIHTSIQ